MIQKLIITGLGELIKLLDAETVKNAVDSLLDKIEDKQIIGEVDTIKEAAITTAIKAIRTILSIDDKSYGSDKE